MKRLQRLVQLMMVHAGLLILAALSVLVVAGVMLCEAGHAGRRIGHRKSPSGKPLYKGRDIA